MSGKQGGWPLSIIPWRWEIAGWTPGVSLRLTDVLVSRGPQENSCKCRQHELGLDLLLSTCSWQSLWRRSPIRKSKWDSNKDEVDGKQIYLEWPWNQLQGSPDHDFFLLWTHLCSCTGPAFDFPTDVLNLQTTGQVIDQTKPLIARCPD